MGRSRWDETKDGVTHLLDAAVQTELASSKSTNHEQTSANTGVRAAETKLLGDLDEAAGGALTGKTLGLVDLGEHGVGRLRDNGGGETSNETGAEVDGGLGAAGSLAFVDVSVRGLVDLLEDDELGHGVRDPVKMISTTGSGRQTQKLEPTA